MQKLIIILLLAGFATTSCKNTKKVQNTPTSEEEIVVDAEINSEETYRLIISFFSPGNGIDYEMKKEFLDFVNNYNSELKYEAVKWGKEGEIDFCFQLSELPANEQIEFVTKANELLSVSRKVRVKENKECRHKK